MEQLAMAIALPLVKQYGMNKALEIAYERLGIASPETRGVDVLTGGGINQAFAPTNLANMAKRGLVNLGIRSLSSSGLGSVLGPVGLIGGIALLGNKYRKQLTGYDTQAAYEAAREKRRADKRLDKITDRIIGGKNYGNYEDALKKSGAGAIEVDGIIYSGPDYQGDGGGGRNSAPTTSPSVGYTDADSTRESRRGRYSEGGIANL
jgi:hypothetical protein